MLPPANQTVSYVPEPTGRGTIGLLRSSLTTFGLCVWTSVHPDIVYTEKGSSGLCYKLAWLMFAFYFPEIMVSCAESQYARARKLHRAWETFWDKNEDPRVKEWLDISGAFFVVMGGYSIRITKPPSEAATAGASRGDVLQSTTAPHGTAATENETTTATSLPAEDEKKPVPPLSLAAVAAAAATRAATIVTAVAGHSMINDIESGIAGSSSARQGQQQQQEGKNEPEDHLITIISPSGFEALLKHKVFQKLIANGTLTDAHFSYRNIKDKAKADDVAKVILTVQILWMVVQCVGRWFDHLSVPPLEIHVVIQILYTAVAYLFWWSKPLNVGEPIYLPIDASVLSECGLRHDFSRESVASYPQNPRFVTERKNRNDMWHMFFRGAYDISVYLDDKTMLVSAVLGLVNGGLHASAWNWPFPTYAEHVLWRVSCFGIGLCPMSLFLLTRERGIEEYGLRVFYNLRFASKPYYKAIWAEIIGLNSDISKGRALYDDDDGILPSHNQSPPQEPVTQYQPKGCPVWSPPWLRFIFLCMGTLITLVYMDSILFLNVTSLTSLRSVPDNVYSTVRWSDILLHF